MTTFEPGSPDSPDRMDALVWALTDLMVGFDVPLTFAPPVIIGQPRGFQARQPGLPHCIVNPVSTLAPQLAKSRSARTKPHGFSIA
jgi:hypothetical protein